MGLNVARPHPLRHGLEHVFHHLGQNYCIAPPRPRSTGLDLGELQKVAHQSRNALRVSMNGLEKLLFGP